MSVHQDPLLQPLVIRHLTLRNRIMSTSHACGLEDHDALPGEVYQRYHEEKARGGLALTMFGGSAYVSPDSTWSSNQLNMSSDRIIPLLRSLTERIHGAGAAAMMQLTHLGRRAETNSQNWLPAIAPSPIRETAHRAFPREMDKHDIDRVIREFGEAARRASSAGLDGIEVLIGGHLIGQFLSPTTNRRTDDFGGSLQNRCRFGLLVYEQMRKQAGDRFLLGMRLLVDEAMTDGLDFDDCVSIARVFEASGLVNFFNANYGRLDTQLKMVTDCMPNMASPIAPWLDTAGRFKAEVGLPVFHAARINDLSTARYAIREGLLDMVAMTRAHIADPQIVNKLKASQEEQIRPCVGATHCMDAGRPTCLHNAATGRETQWPQVISLATETLDAVVVGAGPAGLEAARILAERGHQVTVFEATDRAGGQLTMAAAASWRRDISGIVDWRVAELQRLGVEVHYNTLADATDIRDARPDLVIVATGGLPDLDWLPGSGHCTSVWDILSGITPMLADIIVYDGTGRHPAVTAAELCHDAGRRVQLIMLDDQTAAELDYAERVSWRRELALRKIQPVYEHRLTALERRGNRIRAEFISDLTEQKMTLEAAQVVVEHGTIPEDSLYQALRRWSCNNGITDLNALILGKRQPTEPGNNGFELHRIGDALASRNIAAAMYDALRLCSAK